MTAISGSVDRIVFRNEENGYCVARFRRAEDRPGDGVTTIVGTLPDIFPGELLHLTGVWETHATHGRHFRVERFEEDLPSSAEGIERYLSSGVVRGIGPVTARRLVDAFGDNTIVTLDETPELLTQIPGINERRLDVIKQSWSEQKRVRELSMFLQEHGMSVALARRIFRAYGETARDVIYRDPYRLAHDIQGVGFLTADLLARRLGVSPDSQSRYVAGLHFALSESTGEGHVFLSRPELLRRAVKVLNAPTRELEPALLELLRRGDAVIEGDHVYLAAFHRAETGVATAIEQIRATPSSLTLDRRFDPSEAIRRAGEKQGLTLATKQVEAAEQALREKVSVLTGGPGTGKTSTLRTIITALEAAEIAYCLCAPTGRAAKRVAETTGRSASTIHRLLEYQPATETFAYDRYRPLPFEFVVVDEVSMLDLLLFYHLLKAVPPEAHILLVGDADQLPSIGPGSVLRDLIASGSVPTVTLTELFRQARDSSIIVAAHAINRGQIPRFPERPAGDFFFVRTSTEQTALTVIQKLILERIPLKFGLDPVDDVQVLAPMHGGAVGVTALNESLQRLLNPPGARKTELSRGPRSFRLGDKVMQVRNDYDKDVFNGDVGKVTAIRSSDQVMTVSFGSGMSTVEVDYESQDLDNLMLAYAISVHKAQGSEFPCTIVPVVPRHSIMLQRHLLYTAVTRARQLCILVGSESSLASAVASDRRDRRNSRLAERLARSAERQLALATEHHENGTADAE